MPENAADSHQPAEKHILRHQIPLAAPDGDDLNLSLVKQVPVEIIEPLLDQSGVGDIAFQQVIDEIVHHVVRRVGPTRVTLELCGQQIAQQVEKFHLVLLHMVGVHGSVQITKDTLAAGEHLAQHIHALVIYVHHRPARLHGPAVTSIDTAVGGHSQRDAPGGLDLLPARVLDVLLLRDGHHCVAAVGQDERMAEHRPGQVDDLLEIMGAQQLFDAVDPDLSSLCLHRHPPFPMGG